MRIAIIGLFLASLSAPAYAGDMGADDYLQGCATAADEAACSKSQEDFKKSFLLAWQNNYAAQKDVARCLFDGCNGAVRKNRLTGCAWLGVILFAGHDEVDFKDIDDFKAACATLDKVAKEVAIERGVKFSEKIRRRKQE